MNQKLIEAKIIERSWETLLSINGEIETLSDFLDANYGTTVKDEHVKQLFDLKIKGEMCIGDFKIKRLK